VAAYSNVRARIPTIAQPNRIITTLPSRSSKNDSSDDEIDPPLVQDYFLLYGDMLVLFAVAQLCGVVHAASAADFPGWGAPVTMASAELGQTLRKGLELGSCWLLAGRRVGVWRNVLSAEDAVSLVAGTIINYSSVLCLVTLVDAVVRSERVDVSSLVLTMYFSLVAVAVWRVAYFFKTKWW